MVDLLSGIFLRKINWVGDLHCGLWKLMLTSGVDQPVCWQHPALTVDPSSPRWCHRRPASSTNAMISTVFWSPVPLPAGLSYAQLSGQSTTTHGWNNKVLLQRQISFWFKTSCWQTPSRGCPNCAWQVCRTEYRVIWWSGSSWYFSGCGWKLTEKGHTSHNGIVAVVELMTSLVSGTYD